jgi:hypothetical protein
MPEDKKEPVVEEEKWWIDRGPIKERQKHHEKVQLGQGLIEQWVYGLLHDYSQDQAVKNVVDINKQLVPEFTGGPGEWSHLSLGVGNFPAGKMAKIKGMLKLPGYARALVIDAGYSVRVLVTGEPVGEKLVDLNFTEVPSMDYWVRGELVEERLFSNLDEALRRMRGSLHRYLRSIPAF